MKALDFVLVGAQKSGTTSLYDWLARAPGIFLPESKENWFFACDAFYEQGEAYLASFYEAHAGEPVVGSAYVHSMYFPATAPRIHDHNPAAKIIAVLRNPVDRAYSAYWFARGNGWESADTFEEALQLEDERRKGTFKQRAELTYVDHGRYARQLAPYFELFGPDRVRVILTDELKTDPRGTLSDTLRFLGLDGDTSGIEVIDQNQAAAPRLPTLQRTLHDSEAPLRRLLRRTLSVSARRTMREKFLKPLIRWNARPRPYGPMASETRARLEDIFRSENERLAALIGRTLPW